MLLAAALILPALALAVWIGLRWRHVTENDAKVLADMVTISSRVDGWVAERAVTDGDPVAKGQELVRIDQRETSLEAEALRARLESLRLESERLVVQLAVTRGSTESDVDAARARHDAAEAAMHAAQAEFERTRLDYDRNKRLVDEKVISAQAWDLARTTNQQTEEKMRQSRAQIAEARANLDDALAKRGDVAVLEKQIEQLGADMAQVRAQIRQKEVELGDREVKSPIAGVVDQKFVEPGEFVIPGQRLVLLHDPKSVWIEVHLKETKLADVRPGQPVEISVDAYPGRSFTGEVERIGNAATNQFALLPSPNPSGNFTKIAQRVPVRVRVDQPGDNPLRPGMMVEVDIDASHR
ncbi:HlyD family secretion protein [Solidesulfovibrio sp.]|uniref:HlyD family secretion protein n=1 Tax=Solidesulfovibrio sp. TaxID=2910990 RepID=UPI00262C2FAF|nr:HlyD family secretion protein [Solidesulfovibrio sp.]